MRFSALGVFGFALASCSSSAVTLGLDVGAETDALKRDPAVVTLTAEVVDTSGTRTGLGSAKLPQTEFDLSDAPRSTYLQVEITGKSQSDAKVLFGRTVVLQLGAAEGGTLPIFVQRVGSWARMPSALPDPRAKPLLAPTQRTVLVAGGDGATTSQVLTGYDFPTLKALSAYGATIAPRSFAVANAAAILVGVGTSGDQKVTAVGFDLQNGTLFSVAVPSGGTFDEIIGGPTVQGDDGESYVVGPARREGNPSVRVLKIAKDGTASFIQFNQPRLGAAVTWVKNWGLLVVGGSATADGAELLPKGATVSNTIKLPPDATVGAAAVPLDDTHVIVVGGADGTTATPSRVLDPRCTQACTATPWGAALPFTTSSAQVFALGAKSALLVADDASGATKTFVVDETTVTEVPTRIARQGARATRAPTGNIVLVGGGTATVESYYP